MKKHWTQAGLCKRTHMRSQSTCYNRWQNLLLGLVFSFSFTSVYGRRKVSNSKKWLEGGRYVKYCLCGNDPGNSICLSTGFRYSAPVCKLLVLVQSKPRSEEQDSHPRPGDRERNIQCCWNFFFGIALHGVLERNIWRGCVVRWDMVL